jgi:hypothetical protein
MKIATKAVFLLASVASAGHRSYGFCTGNEGCGFAKPGDTTNPPFFADVDGDGRADFCGWGGTLPSSYTLFCILSDATPQITHESNEDPRVGAFLDVLNLTHYAAHFVSHEVDYETLLGLTDAELKEVGVKALGARKRILKQTQKQELSGQVGAASANSSRWHG